MAPNRSDNAEKLPVSQCPIPAVRATMGQYIQEGERFFFETVISVTKPKHQLVIPTDKDNLDQLNYLSGKRFHQINKMAELGTKIAHIDGGVPNLHIEIPEINEYNLGALIYFFEKACALSGYTLGVNPFDQPGVEAYKKNMMILTPRTRIYFLLVRNLIKCTHYEPCKTS